MLDPTLRERFATGATMLRTEEKHAHRQRVTSCARNLCPIGRMTELLDVNEAVVTVVGSKEHKGRSSRWVRGLDEKT